VCVIVIIFVCWRIEHGTTVRVAAYEHSSLVLGYSCMSCVGFYPPSSVVHSVSICLWWGYTDSW